MTTDPDPAYETIAEFGAELVRRGVSEVVISPGSRSTPLALCLAAQPGLRTWVHLDERSAGYFALGLARATGRPPVLVCTSGTAAANYLPAIVEAHHAGVPLIACTADRPPELRDWGAGQTIDQVGLYGAATRWDADLPVAGEIPVRHFRSTAMRAVAIASGVDPGPVHLNWPLREPLEPRSEAPVNTVEPTANGELTVIRDPTTDGSDFHDGLADLAGRPRGVVVVGPWPGRGLVAEQALAAAVDRFAATVGWPVLGEPLTHVRRGGEAVTVSAAERLLADDRFASETVPEVVIRIGRSPTTKSVRLWLERHRPERVVLVDPSHHWHDASFTVTDHLAVDPRVALAVPSETRTDSDWIRHWRSAEAAARVAIDRVGDDGPLLSAAVARTVVGSTPGGEALMISNSMPVRLLDTFVGAVTGPVVVGNRGASGIDGITSTALGLAAAASSRSAALLTGDLALLHDLSGLISAKRLGLHLTVVCIDNAGGGIFAMLPVFERVPRPEFEQLFRTPHGLELTGLDGFGGVRATITDSRAGLGDLVASSMALAAPGVDLVIVPVDRDADRTQQRTVAEAVRHALDEIDR